MSARSPLSQLKGVSGQSLVELALVLPVLVGILLGIIDVSRAIYAYNSITNLSREGANLASRSGQTYSDQQIMDVLADTATPLAMASNGMMYITKAQADGSGWTVTHQEGWKNGVTPASALTDSASIAAVLGPIDSRSGRSVCICEVYYQYDSLFLPSKLDAAFAPLLHSTSIF